MSTRGSSGMSFAGDKGETVMGFVSPRRPTRWRDGEWPGRRGVVRLSQAEAVQVAAALQARCVESVGGQTGAGVASCSGSSPARKKTRAAVAEPLELSRLKCPGHHPKGNTGSNALQTK